MNLNETHELILHKEKEWGKDTDNPRGQLIEVWRFERAKPVETQKPRPLHLNITTDKDYLTSCDDGKYRTKKVDVDMSWVEECLRKLAGEGGENWPSYIDPIPLDEIYGVTKRSGYEKDDFEWIAYIAWVKKGTVTD